MGRAQRLLMAYILLELEELEKRLLRRPPRRYGGGFGASHDRLHALSSALDHSGTITATQHGTLTSIPNAHHTPLELKGMKVYLGSVQSINPTTWTVIDLDTVLWDDWTTSFNTTTHRWTVPETTRYLIVCGVMWTNVTNAIDCQIRFRRTTGGSPLYGVGGRGVSGAVTGYYGQREQTTASFTLGDVFEFQCYHDFVTARNIGSTEPYTFLSITKIE